MNRSFLLLFFLGAFLNGVLAQTVNTLADNLIILSSNTPNNFAGGNVLLKQNAFVINGTPYDVTFTVIRKMGTTGGRVRLVENNPGSFNLQMDGVHPEENPMFVYNLKVVEHGSATTANPVGIPVTVYNLKMYLPDVDGVANLFTGAADPNRMYVDIAGYRVTGGTPPVVTTDPGYLPAQDYYNNPLGTASVNYTAGFTKYRSNVSTRDYSDNTLTNTSALNYSVSRYAVNFDFAEFPVTGIDLMFGVTSDPNQVSATPDDASRSFFHVFSVDANTNVLPVTLADFNVLDQSGQVKLNWSTVFEQNNKGFEIERSADGRNWAIIGFVKSKDENGNSSTQLDYTFIDKAPTNGSNYYRLKQIDFDGKYDYSDTKYVTIRSHIQYRFYPNPIKEVLNITGLTGTETIIIYDIAGRMIKQVKSANNLQPIPLNTLQAGIYHIQVITANGTSTLHKVIKSE